ncbi:MAG TPA: arsenic transporter [Bryobacteraceae bacterium]
MTDAAIWAITALTIAGILIRPKGWPEYIWACLGAILLIACRLITPEQASLAAQKGTQVYCFLAGMLLLAEMARRQGLFDWLAVRAVNAAKGSRIRLFALIYCVGVVVTALLSNDATAVVLTPAVYAAVKRAGGAALPYLFICAFVANAASFVFPISNPANLVIFGRSMPPLAHWLQFFALPSAVSILATYAGLRLLSRKQLTGKMNVDVSALPLTRSGAAVGTGILGTAIVLAIASALAKPLGFPTLIAALVVFGCVLFLDRTAFAPTLREISWGILPLVAGLFVVVGALSETGVSASIQDALHVLASWPDAGASLAASFGSAIVCNIANNLPVGLLARTALQGHVAPPLRNALAIGIDLGPNFSITGSLATILWLIALRREGERVSFLTFLKYGIAINSPALLLTTLAVLAGS